MLSTTIETYGGPFVDAAVVQNPQSEQASDDFNRALEDLAQLTRTGYRAIVQFICNASTNPPSSDVSHVSVWGSGDAQKPTVSRNTTGIYTVEYDTDFVDGLGETESVAFVYAHASAMTNTNTLDEAKVKRVNSTTVDVAVFSAGVLSDLSGTGKVTVWIR